MSAIDPDNTTVADICKAALQECGAVGIGQTPGAAEMADAQVRLQWMLQQWNVKRYLVYRIATSTVVSTGADFYTVGPGGDFSLSANTTRPDKLEYAYLRQANGTGIPVDYPIDLLQAKEDYSQIALKSMKGFSTIGYYEPAFPLGILRLYPVALANIYSILINFKQPLISEFSSLDSDVSFPYEYFWPIVTNLAMALMNKYGMRLSPGNTLPARAKDGLATLRGANTAIKSLRLPNVLRTGGGYNIFSDK